MAACIWESVGNHVPLSAKTAGDKPPRHGGVQIRRGFGSLHFTSGKERGTSPRATAEYKCDAASGVSTLRQVKSGGQAPTLRRSTNTTRLRESPLCVRQKAEDKPLRYGGVQIRCGFGSLHFTSGKERGTSLRATAENKYVAASGVSTLRQAKSGGQAPALRRSTNTMRLRESPLYVRQGAGDKPPRYIRIRPHCLGAGHALLTPSTPLRYPTPVPRKPYSLPHWLWVWSGSGRVRS